eukprot:CAMPEP_0170460596 /NCGR_PEP_ID=MMETSP0123-20130129/6878_1 /TAXON_ID=182087 /ORGANISM="Favella ehrenbergii, Strain Fehren 1" /LENGTH=61 /DNA_ID=CAMNT_0010725527 /DNA_START=1280 /DNA_END=1465 /DNA_ORIENTATION=+
MERGQVRKVSPDDDSVLNSDAEQSQSSFSAHEVQEAAGSVVEDAAGNGTEEEKKDYAGDLP